MIYILLYIYKNIHNSNNNNNNIVMIRRSFNNHTCILNSLSQTRFCSIKKSIEQKLYIIISDTIYNCKYQPFNGLEIANLNSNDRKNIETLPLQLKFYNIGSGVIFGCVDYIVENIYYLFVACIIMLCAYVIPLSFAQYVKSRDFVTTSEIAKRDKIIKKNNNEKQFTNLQVITPFVLSISSYMIAYNSSLALKNLFTESQKYTKSRVMIRCLYIAAAMNITKFTLCVLMLSHNGITLNTNITDMNKNEYNEYVQNRISNPSDDLFSKLGSLWCPYGYSCI
ncbi:hypothetical protein BMW23_0745 [Bodo saltans virus]|uniref:Uncharacterized protein n=1 Tax=Bodo saltans virus TaxID=2024608 RepID=A0A2H4UV44_9VIRU|nr:hypothetical protein QJ851_gp0728 [Bodo saltans virus]ATZ80791.1 hypothetical protein BMW23_0745 [Bodo saltans virus]